MNERMIISVFWSYIEINNTTPSCNINFNKGHKQHYFGISFSGDLKKKNLMDLYGALLAYILNLKKKKQYHNDNKSTRQITVV